MPIYKSIKPTFLTQTCEHCHQLLEKGKERIKVCRGLTSEWYHPACILWRLRKVMEDRKLKCAKCWGLEKCECSKIALDKLRK